MSWTDIIIAVNKKDAKIVEEIAGQYAQQGIFIEDYSDLEKNMHLVGGDYIDDKLKDADKENIAVHIYISADEDEQKTMDYLSGSIRAAGISFEINKEYIPDQDWENDWKKYHKPLHLGERLVVAPSWEDYMPSEDEIVIIMDPGSSFGTGKDETTKLCMRLLESNLDAGDKVLDLGCGTGILAIAAILLGAESAVGVDIDGHAVQDAVENASTNKVEDRFSGYEGDLLSRAELRESVGSGYDLICANIIADVHLAMRELYYEKIKVNGKLIISGIVDERTGEIEEALVRTGFILMEAVRKNGWTALSFIRN